MWPEWLVESSGKRVGSWAARNGKVWTGREEREGLFIIGLRDREGLNFWLILGVQ